MSPNKDYYHSTMPPQQARQRGRTIDVTLSRTPIHRHSKNQILSLQHDAQFHNKTRILPLQGQLTHNSTHTHTQSDNTQIHAHSTPVSRAQSGKASASNVRVVIRIRPPNENVSYSIQICRFLLYFCFCFFFSFFFSQIICDLLF